MTRARQVMRALASGVLAAGTACTAYDQQSALHPAGPEAAAIHRLWYFMLAVAAVVYILVVGALLLIRRRTPDAPDERHSAARERTALRGTQAAVAVALVVVFVTLIADFSLVSAMHRPSSTMLTIRVTGHQWWWDVEYEDPMPQNRVRLANEIHVPVGRPVMLKLAAYDVIHSLWIPNLAGKKDLIPGHPAELWIRADRPGTYRAQCAEFCGLQHAKMALVVVAEPAQQFAEWLAHERSPATPPADSQAQRGQLVFETGSCALCHAIASTRAAAHLGPDLTHVANRRSLAAGTLRNTPANLAGWILDPQTIKPGVLMPVNPLAPADLRALLAYLETLR